MTKVLIIGAHGAMARLVTERLLNETDDELVLFLRNAQRLNQYKNDMRVTLIEGNTLVEANLVSAMKDVDIVYSNAGGTDLGEQTGHILAAMRQVGLTRLIYISALGAHHEVNGRFGQWNEQAISAFLPGFRKAAIDYTEIRPTWLTNNNEIDYNITKLNEPFTETEVSRASVADVVVHIINNPSEYIRESIGIGKPGSDGDKPSWM
jgi:uncharacterized protein YbjT (DUF2867 family)